MLKASWGGGGKGIRKCFNDGEVRSMFKQVQGEVPGSPIFAMKLAPPSRHLEVQLVADSYGNVVSIHSRDCSIQRRHQKIVEEGPITAASAETVAEMERCARALARAVGYVGAATVEYLYSLEDGGYFFLELNPRLQVEHPVTEWISGVNLPVAQLLIGMGVPLYRIPDIRRFFGRDVNTDDPIDFEEEKPVPPLGHVVAVRITSEDADDGFKPTTGKIDEISFRSTPDVWGYFSIKSGGRIHEYSDSQFGHLFAKGDTRTAAIRSMVVALRELRIRGEIRTIVDYCTDMIQHKDFLENKIHTGWLDSRIAAQTRTEKLDWHLAVVCGAVLLAHNAVAANSAEYVLYLEKGQIPPSTLSLTEFDEEICLDGIKYQVYQPLHATFFGGGSFLGMLAGMRFP
jgi:acetyl-CoA carboxylase/biotin carboxylase 1